jgi:hypothetical protein
MQPPTSHPALTLEETGWQALSTSGEAAQDFYRQVLADEPVMLFPGGFVLDGRDAIVASMGGPPWSWYRLEDARVFQPTPETALVTYRATARRYEQPDYVALMSSLYVRVGNEWKLIFHQHTPVG